MATEETKSWVQRQIEIGKMYPPRLSWEEYAKRAQESRIYQEEMAKEKEQEHLHSQWYACRDRKSPDTAIKTGIAESDTGTVSELANSI